MSGLVLGAFGLVALAVLAFGVYFPRHHRRDLVAAFPGANVGVLAVAMMPGSASVGPGLGTGPSGMYAHAHDLERGTAVTDDPPRADGPSVPT
ncbi:DUF4956 domain-containing protein, partial [Streptomyces sp. NPDC058625]|uniref:DUF4956 domain-containing protein n=1 Tax=Streptomyces sp. NPDC058625 TaxID=3346564 RepID=UPI003657B1A3